MAHQTRHDNLRASEALDLRAMDRVLDIGTGHGRALSVLAAATPSGVVTGIDPSELMVEIATTRNAALVNARRVQVLKADAEDLPFPDKAFDKVMAVHSIYFWPSLSDAFEQIARVLKPGGRLALVFRSASDERAVAAFPADIYRFPELTEVSHALEAAGLGIVHIDKEIERHRSLSVLIVAARGG
jgi:ubiquinone/menaquinone biosynthesis C-methylase UbiE